MNRLQISTFSLLPALLVSVAGALDGRVRLRLAHVFVAPVLAVSFLNHSRDYHDGPCMDAIDATDRVAVASLSAACAVDLFRYAETWRAALAGAFGAAALVFFALSRSLKEKILKGAAPTVQNVDPLGKALDPEIVHSWMHACAGIATFLVVV